MQISCKTTTLFIPIIREVVNINFHVYKSTLYIFETKKCIWKKIVEHRTEWFKNDEFELYSVQRCYLPLKRTSVHILNPYFGS